ncbi:transporter [Mycobacterium sp. 1164966.3]|uniref:PH-like domain-containing protein n=1 Tax=Mycobacterium sp. 1164966.3 TaxID=1856861 RepID=UPI000801D4DF|nr:transporter [Mycobacterium sp. 1164966.3]OBA81285.1 transporter [Mycobacterium sp. 1164966.3]
MNSGTLVGSLIFAAVLVVVIAFVIQLMMRGWRSRAQRQAELLGALPELPDRVGSATITTRGHYCGCTLAPNWNDRVAVGDLGYRTKAVMSRHPEGILIERIRARPIWIPGEAISAIRTERGMAGKVGSRAGILAIRWRLPSGVEMDTGFRARSRDDYTDWVDGWQEAA